MRLQYTYATMYVHIHMYTYLMYVHSLVVKKDLQLRHGAIVRVEKRQFIKKHPETLGPRESRCVCWTMDNGYDDMDLQLIGYMYIHTLCIHTLRTVR